MYKCCDCGCVFEEPKHYSEDRTPGGAFEGGSFIEHYEGCPYCSGAFEEATECDGCGEYFFESCLVSTKDGRYCEDCLEEMGYDEDEDEEDE